MLICHRYQREIKEREPLQWTSWGLWFGKGSLYNKQMVLKIIEGSDWERKEFNWKDRTKADWSYGGQSEVNIRDECKFKNHVELPGMENPKKVWFKFLSFGNILNGEILGGFQGILGFIFGLFGSCFHEFIQV